MTFPIILLAKPALALLGIVIKGDIVVETFIAATKKVENTAPNILTRNLLKLITHDDTKRKGVTLHNGITFDDIRSKLEELDGLRVIREQSGARVTIQKNERNIDVDFIAIGDDGIITDMIIYLNGDFQKIIDATPKQGNTAFGRLATKVQGALPPKITNKFPGFKL